MSKTPALSTQLKTAQNRIVELEKQITSEKSTLNYNRERADKATEEIEQVHAILDAIPAAPERKRPHPNGYGEMEYKLSARLAAYFATRE